MTPPPLRLHLLPRSRQTSISPAIFRIPATNPADSPSYQTQLAQLSSPLVATTSVPSRQNLEDNQHPSQPWLLFTKTYLSPSLHQNPNALHSITIFFLGNDQNRQCPVSSAKNIKGKFLSHNCSVPYSLSHLEQTKKGTSLAYCSLNHRFQPPVLPHILHITTLLPGHQLPSRYNAPGTLPTLKTILDRGITTKQPPLDVVSTASTYSPVPPSSFLSACQTP